MVCFVDLEESLGRENYILDGWAGEWKSVLFLVGLRLDGIRSSVDIADAISQMLHRFGDSDFRESYTPFAWLLPPAEAIAKALYRKPK